MHHSALRSVQRLLYNLLFPIALLLMLPGFAVRMIKRGKYRHKFGQRFGIYSDRVRARIKSMPRIWMHAVSVGEVLIARKLMNQLRTARPDLGFVLSTTTSTGFTLARENAPEWLEVIYNPIDFPWFVASALDLVSPRLLILVEAEVWPNLVAMAKNRDISVALVNARLSPRSEKRFLKFKWLAGPSFASLDAVCVQEPQDVDRFTSIGTRPDRTYRTGSIKFDQQGGIAPDASRVEEHLRKAGWREGAPVLVAASTHAGEETILAAMALRLRRNCPDLFPVFVPRHAERGGEVLKDIQAAGLRPALRTELPDNPTAGTDCLVVNSTGELIHWYAHATVVFVGKSLTAEGGQNPVEPAVAGAAVVVGPNMQNFTAVVDMLLAEGGICQASDETDLERIIHTLLADPGRRLHMQTGAIKALEPHQGSAMRTTRILLGLAFLNGPAEKSPAGSV